MTTLRREVSMTQVCLYKYPFVKESLTDSLACMNISECAFLQNHTFFLRFGAGGIR